MHVRTQCCATCATSMPNASGAHDRTCVHGRSAHVHDMMQRRGELGAAPHEVPEPDTRRNKTDGPSESISPPGELPLRSGQWLEEEPKPGTPHLPAPPINLIRPSSSSGLLVDTSFATAARTEANGGMAPAEPASDEAAECAAAPLLDRSPLGISVRNASSRFVRCAQQSCNMPRLRCVLGSPPAELEGDSSSTLLSFSRSDGSAIAKASQALASLASRSAAS